MTKQEFVEILEKAKNEGEQLIALEIPSERYDVAVDIEFNSYRGKKYYDISLDANKDGEHVEIDARLLIGEELMAEMMDDFDDQTFDRIVNEMATALWNEVEEDKEEVPAE